MKKLLTLLITGAMLLSAFSITAYADDTTVELNNKSQQTAVSATYKTAGADYWNDVKWEDATIAVNVSWTNTDYVYNFGTEWDTENHVYKEGSGWDGTNYLDVFVVNHSNCPINVELDDIDVIDGLTLDFENNKTSAQLTSAIDPTNVNADKNQAEFNLTFDYEPGEFVSEPTDFFSFNVKISPVA